LPHDVVEQGVEIAMSATFSGQLSGRPVRRVREEVRDGLAVIAFSAAASLTLAVVLMLLAQLAE
jgi:hypothetical protein